MDLFRVITHSAVERVSCQLEWVSIAEVYSKSTAHRTAQFFTLRSRQYRLIRKRARRLTQNVLDGKIC